MVFPTIWLAETGISGPPKSVYYPENPFLANQSTGKFHFQNGLQNKEFPHKQTGYFLAARSFAFVVFCWLLIEQKIYTICHGFGVTNWVFLCPRAESPRAKKPFSARKSMTDYLCLLPFPHSEYDATNNWSIVFGATWSRRYLLAVEITTQNNNKHPGNNCRLDNRHVAITTLVLGQETTTLQFLLVSIYFFSKHSRTKRPWKKSCVELYIKFPFSFVAL